LDPESIEGETYALDQLLEASSSGLIGAWVTARLNA
jgi:hypothetical protein